MLLRNQSKKVNQFADLLNRVQIAFAHTEANGIKIDIDKLNKNIVIAERRLVELENQIFTETEVGRRWKEAYGSEASFTARNQLGTVLFKNHKNARPNNMGFTATSFTAIGAVQCDASSLEHIPEIKDFTDLYVNYMTLTKCLSTYLHGIKSALDKNGFIHPSFSLMSVISYRSSSSNPNFQNLPHHNPEISALVRDLLIPRLPTNHLCELDYSGAEVRINASINHDPTLVGSVTRGVDFHKAIAAKAYLLDESQVTKSLRQSVKGLYTFAAFYGSYWAKIGVSLWEQIIYGNLTLEDGTPLLQHLKKMGIKSLGNVNKPVPGTYLYHIKKTDEWFWGDMFKVYDQWKRDNWSHFRKTGYVEGPTGFRCAGVFSRNLSSNMGAQGGAAHCLLWSLCQIEDKIAELGLKTKICGQIHDSILLDIPHDELDTVLKLANNIMTIKLREHFPWIAVPMEIEADVSPMGKSWLEKRGYPIPT